MIEINVIDASDVAARLRNIPSGIDKALARTAEDVFDFVERRVDAHTKTGAMRDALFSRKDGYAYLIGHDMARAPHAAFVHWGTRPHTIKPKDKKALRWVAGGAFAFAKSVRHPGYKGDAYMVDAAREAPLIFERHVQSMLKEV